MVAGVVRGIHHFAGPTWQAPDGSLVKATTASEGGGRPDGTSPYELNTDRVFPVIVLEGVPAGGGLVGARGPGGSRLLLDGEVRTTGAVGALLGEPAQVRASQGGTPTGDVWTVTRSAPHMVLELGGRRASIRQAEALGEDGADQPAALGLLLDDRAEEPDRGQLLLVPILGTAPTGGLHVAQTIPVGRVVRFLRTGPVEVEADVVAALGPFAPGPEGALLFPADGRAGDAQLVSDLLGCPVAGVAVSAPLAPVAGRSRLHGPGTTSLVVFP